MEANAKQRGVEIVSERVIYRLLEQAVEWLTDAAPRVAREVVLGQAQILQVLPSAFFPLTAERWIGDTHQQPECLRAMQSRRSF